MFSCAQNSEINHFNSIFKSGKFWGVTHLPVMGFIDHITALAHGSQTVWWIQVANDSIILTHGSLDSTI